MGRFAEELKRAMREKNVRQIDFKKLSKNKVSVAVISGIFQKDTLPRTLELIDEIARVLGEPAEDFRRYAAIDAVQRALDHYHRKLHDIVESMEKPAKKEYKVPLYRIKDLLSCFSQKGYPVKESSKHLNLGFDLGVYAYAIEMDTTALSPRVGEGDIAFFAPSLKLKKNIMDYALVRIQEKLFLGRILEAQSYITLEMEHPYRIYQIARKEILYLHKVVIVLKPELEELLT